MKILTGEDIDKSGEGGIENVVDLERKKNGMKSVMSIHYGVT